MTKIIGINKNKFIRKNKLLSYKLAINSTKYPFFRIYKRYFLISDRRGELKYNDMLFTEQKFKKNLIIKILN